MLGHPETINRYLEDCFADAFGGIAGEQAADVGVVGEEEAEQARGEFEACAGTQRWFVGDQVFVVVVAGGRYELAISYGRSASGGGTLKLSVGDESIECCPSPTPTPDVFERMHLGSLTLDEGSSMLKAEVLEAHGNELMRLNRIFLQPIEPMSLDGEQEDD